MKLSLTLSLLLFISGVWGEVNPITGLLEKGNLLEGKKDGAWEIFYKDGTLHSIVHYKQGKKYGLAQTFFKNGKLLSECSWVLGRLNGTCKLFNRGGNIVSYTVWERGERKGYVCNEEFCSFYPIKKFGPQYPKRAQIKEAEGCVMAEFDIDKKGRAKNIKTVWSHSVGKGGDYSTQFEKETLKVVKRFRYSPAKMYGEAIEAHKVLNLITFILDPTKSPGYYPKGCKQFRP